MFLKELIKRVDVNRYHIRMRKDLFISVYRDIQGLYTYRQGIFIKVEDETPEMVYISFNMSRYKYEKLIKIIRKNYLFNDKIYVYTKSWKQLKTAI